jgi:hypothetical protein
MPPWRSHHERLKRRAEAPESQTRGEYNLALRQPIRRARTVAIANDLDFIKEQMANCRRGGMSGGPLCWR